MARLGNYGNGKNTDHGRLYWGDKDIEYQKKLSRDWVEEIHNVSLLYFEIDWENSRRNWYGELLYKKFKNPLGVEINGWIKMNQGSEQLNNGIPNKIMKLNFACYVEHLKELNIEPNIGEYFSYGQRIYLIYDKTLNDYGPGNVIGNRERMRVDFFAIQEDDEVLFSDPWANNKGTDIDIRNGGIQNL